MEPLRTEARLEMDAEQLETYAGRYVRAETQDREVLIEATPPDLKWTSPDGASYTLVPISEDVFIDPDDGEKATFARTADGMTLTAGRTVFERIGIE